MSKTSKKIPKKISYSKAYNLWQMMVKIREEFRNSKVFEEKERFDFWNERVELLEKQMITKPDSFDKKVELNPYSEKNINRILDQTIKTMAKNL